MISEKKTKGVISDYKKVTITPKLYLTLCSEMCGDILKVFINAER